uniref:BTB (POZ) domain containing 17a n=1 Tax=Salmo trutta TaxID=8032 RepID=A0A674AE28_SALTR
SQTFKIIIATQTILWTLWRLDVFGSSTTSFPWVKHNIHLDDQRLTVCAGVGLERTSLLYIHDLFPLIDPLLISLRLSLYLSPSHLSLSPSLSLSICPLLISLSLSPSVSLSLSPSHLSLSVSLCLSICPLLISLCLPHSLSLSVPFSSLSLCLPLSLYLSPSHLSVSLSVPFSSLSPSVSLSLYVPFSSLCLPLHKLATKYRVQGLQQGVTQYMTQNLASSSGPAVEWYQYALQTGEVALRDTCLQYLSWNLSSVLQSEEWTTVSIDLLMSLLQRLELISQSEMELFTALEAWINQNEPYSLTAENALRAVRYGMMLPWELFRLQTLSPLLARYQESVRGLLYHPTSSTLPPPSTWQSTLT